MAYGLWTIGTCQAMCDWNLKDLEIADALNKIHAKATWVVGTKTDFIISRRLQPTGGDEVDAWDHAHKSVTAVVVYVSTPATTATTVSTQGAVVRNVPQECIDRAQRIEERIIQADEQRERQETLLNESRVDKRPRIEDRQDQHNVVQRRLQQQQHHCHLIPPLPPLVPLLHTGGGQQGSTTTAAAAAA